MGNRWETVANNRKLLISSQPVSRISDGIFSRSGRDQAFFIRLVAPFSFFHPQAV